ncbi:MAG: hypothetical protein H7A46_18450 [Verrucomicrobiales bacterium]|nr:hypothetical protein [Verrucomicrobiales bacterium]
MRAADWYFAQSNPNYDPGADNSINNPQPFTVNAANTFIAANTEANLYLESGANAYTISTWSLPGGLPTTQIVRLYGISAPGDDPSARPVFRSVVTSGGLPSQYGASAQSTWLLNFNQPVGRLEVHDLIIDGNWPTWAAAATAASPTWFHGLAVNALQGRATTGLIRNVRIKNCGAHGQVPGHFALESGIEAFPLFLHATDYSYGIGPNGETLETAWVVEDCEISDFYSLHGGYASLIMAMTENPHPEIDPDDYPDHRPFEVRRCQIRGNRHTIAFGSSNSAGVSYHDNVVLCAGIGMNHDTANEVPLRNMDLNNNVFLDVDRLANVGGPLWGIGSSGKWQFRNYHFEGNAIRLRGVPLKQDYRSYEWITNTIGSFTAIMPVTDPTLALGRFETGYSAGLQLAGAGPVTFVDNRFTTRPMADFYEPDPGNGTVSTARWTPVFRPGKDPETHRVCHQSGAVDPQSGNTRSATAMDFTALAGITGTNLVSDGAGQLIATNALPGGFTPGGWPGRVLMGLSGDELDRIYEVQVSCPVVTSNTVTVHARLVYHPTQSSGLTQTGNAHPTPFADNSLHLLVTDGPNEGEYNNAPAWTNNVATLTYPADVAQGGLVPGRDRIVVYVDQGDGFTPDATAWAGTEIQLGTTVRFGRAPDVADDRRLNSGTLRLLSSASTNVIVHVHPATSGVTRPATLGQDYDLKDELGINMNTLPGGDWALTVPPGSTGASFKVVPRDDSSRHVAEYEAAWFQIVPDSAYAIAPPEPETTAIEDGSVAVTLWDGAKYRIKPLDDSHYFTCEGMNSASTGEDGGLEQESLVSTITLEETVELLAEVAAGIRPATDPTLQALALAGLLPEETVRQLGILPSDPEDIPAPPREPMLTRIRGTGLEEALAAEWLELEALGMNPTTRSENGVPTVTVPVSGEAGLESSPVYSLQALWLLAFGINQQDQAGDSRVAGYSYFYDSYYGCLPKKFELGGYWVNPDELDDMTEVNDPAYGYAEMVAVANDGVCVGTQYSGSYYRPVRNEAGVNTWLPDLGYGGEALSIGPGDDRIAGWCREYAGGAGYYRAMRWDQSGASWSSNRLGDFNGNTSPGSTINAYAFGINGSGVTVGKCQTNDVGNLVYRAFRTGAGSPINSTAGLEVIAPPDGAPTNTSDFVSTANAISAAGHAVGSSTTYYKRSSTYQKETRATIWWAGQTTARDLRTMHLLLVGDQSPGRSEALAVANNPAGVTVVGTAWITPTGYSRAFKMDIAFSSGNHDWAATSAKMLDLNDPQLSWCDQAGVTLSSAEAVNDAGIIVANGYRASAPTYPCGFVLEPQAVAPE